MKTFYIKTFGCQMNEHDSDKMRALLTSEGYTEVDFYKKADLVLFNTCTVREKSHHKAISEVGKALKHKERHPHVLVGMTGCVAQEERSNLFEIFPDIDIVLGPDQIWQLTKMVKELEKDLDESAGHEATDLVNKYEDYKFVFATPDIQEEMGKAPVAEFVTIMKGCNNFCSFCIVPYVRGREVSKSPDDIVREVSKLCDRGVREITLLGQNVNSYGQDKDEFGTFTDLINRISKETSVERVRYTSPHPKDLSDELIMAHKNNKKLCEHIHLPVQAGSSEVLERMNRKYTREDYLGRIAKLRDEVPGISISTDIIVGFPGETDKQFEETISLMEEVEFDGMFAFKYSTRPGTAADRKFKDDVSDEDKRKRLAKVLDLNLKIVLKKHQKYIGTTQEILIEGVSSKFESQIRGRTRTNKIVNFEGSKDLIGSLVNVKIDWAGPNSLRGIII